MIIVTNRNLQPRSAPQNRFGSGFNEKGPDELRLATAKYTRGRWQVDIVDDEVVHRGERMHASEKLFLELQDRMRRRNRPCMFFVHGFNNDFSDVLERSRQFERAYGVEVVAFTWPANGRDAPLGRVGGTLSYKSDKRDAADRTFEKLGGYLPRYEDRSKRCNQRMSLFMHSMGNYLFKHLMRSSVYTGETALFDNVNLVADDVNNKDHAEWVDRIAYRRRLYVTINEDDSALRVSRMKFGERQLARLGHYTQNLTSHQAIYLDFTGARHVQEESHAYFLGEPIERNQRVRRVFRRMIRGERAEEGLPYNTHNRTYEV